MARITVASYNVHWGYDRRGNAFDVVEVCRRLDADLLVLQESWLPDGRKSEADRAAAELGYTATHATMGPGRVQGARDGRPKLCRASLAEGMLALTMLSRLPATVTTVIEMMNLPLDEAPRRVAVRADVEVDGAGFSYVGTHLSHLTHGSPLQLARLVAQLPPPDRPAALAGDMNMWGPVLRRLVPGWKLAVKGRTWPNGFPHSQIDHIVVNDRVRPISGAVFNEGRSDHLPVWATLDF